MQFLPPYLTQGYTRQDTSIEARAARAFCSLTKKAVATHGDERVANVIYLVFHYGEVRCEDRSWQTGYCLEAVMNRPEMDHLSVTLISFITMVASPELILALCEEALDMLRDQSMVVRVEVDCFDSLFPEAADEFGLGRYQNEQCLASM